MRIQVNGKWHDIVSSFLTHRDVLAYAGKSNGNVSYADGGRTGVLTKERYVYATEGMIFTVEDV